MDELLTGKICPYCGKPTEFVDSSVIYGRSYGMIYLCRDCRAYVGVHKGTRPSIRAFGKCRTEGSQERSPFLF